MKKKNIFILIILIIISLGFLLYHKWETNIYIEFTGDAQFREIDLQVSIDDYCCF